MKRHLYFMARFRHMDSESVIIPLSLMIVLKMIVNNNENREICMNRDTATTDLECELFAISAKANR